MPTDKPKEFSWQDRRKSFGHAFRGIKHVLRTQHNAWLHAVATIVVASMGFAFRITSTEWCLLIICLTLVWTAEAMNTALEVSTDLVSPEFHPLAGQCKDVAAGAVLISAIGAGLVGFIVFGPRLLQLAIQ